MYYSELPNESTGTHTKTWPKMQLSTLIRVIYGSTLSKLCILAGQYSISNKKNVYIFYTNVFTKKFTVVKLCIIVRQYSY